jgi:hypothetical protein
MAVPRSSLTNEGALYELIARGNKDEYFFRNDFSSINQFDVRYKNIPAQVHELRRIPPLNDSSFGRTCEFEFDVAGEVFTDPTVLISLPSWLPPSIAAENQHSVFSDLSGVSHGYTNGIAYFLFSKIQIYLDQILLQEFSGEALYMASRSRGSLNSAFLKNTVTGVHGGTPLEISRAAAPPMLRLQLPLLGCQHPDDGGFPSIAGRQQTYKLRLTLRKLEDLVETSDKRMKPTPWATSFIQKTQKGTTTFQSLGRTEIGNPSLQLETRHTYVDAETRDRLGKSILEIPFSRLYENVFTFGPKDYDPLTRSAVALGSRRLEGVHPASRLLFWFYTTQNLNANRYIPETTEYYNALSLTIAGRERETSFSSLVWNKLQVHAKEDRDPGPGIGFMNWDLGDLRGRLPPFARQPEGSVNFSTADRPTILVDLKASVGSSTEFRVVVDTWAVYQFENGRGGLKYGN